MGFIETSYGGKPNLSDVNIDSALNMGSYGISSSGSIDISGISSENAGEVDLNNCDLVGVKRFMCQDYLGALLANASDTYQKTVVLNNISGGSSSKQFRVPSNFIQGSSIKLEFYAKGGSSSSTAYVQRYDTNTSSYINLTSVSVPNSTSWLKTNAFNVNAGDLLRISYSGLPTYYIYGGSGVKIYYDPIAISDSIWEVIN